MEPASKRRRLKPDERISEILDAAADLVITDGIAQLNMDRIAARAGVSKGLLYAYFPNVKVLLQEVLLREHREQQRAQMEAIAVTDDFETMARATAHINHARNSERGLLLERLRGDPEVASVMLPVDRKTRAGVLAYLVEQVTRNFEIPADVAKTATELAIGPGHDHDKLTPQQIERMDEIWGAMMVGAMKELAARYQKQDT